jgi:hypothetical protein
MDNSFQRPKFLVKSSGTISSLNTELHFKKIEPQQERETGRVLAIVHELGGHG